MAELLDATCGHSGCANAGTYTMDGYCGNCGREYTLKLTKGHEAPGVFLGKVCPHCGCSRVSACTLKSVHHQDTHK